MAEKLPVKYENKEHDVFAPGDTLPANVVNLFAHLREGAGIRLTPLAGGRVRIDNLCCEEPCVPNWQNTGQTRCGSSDTIEAEQTDGCGNTRWQNTGTPCEEPCVPNWQNTGTTRCTGANVENQQADGCGNLRWTDSGTPVTWTASGETRCNTTTNKVENEEVNQCGDARWVATVEDCECVPNWQNTGTQRCTGAYIEDQQADGCGNLRWQATATPVSWTDTGETRCEGSNYQSRQTNQCGDSRWHTTAPIAWTATGQQRCSAANVEVEEQNQCGTLRWRNTGTPVAWTATGPATCESGTLRVPEQNQCGQTRVRDTGVPVSWTNNGAPSCEEGTLKQSQVNQCGTTRVVDTGVSCGGEGCTPYCSNRHAASASAFFAPWPGTTTYPTNSDALAAIEGMGSPPNATAVQDFDGGCWWVVNLDGTVFPSCGDSCVPYCATRHAAGPAAFYDPWPGTMSYPTHAAAAAAHVAVGAPVQASIVQDSDGGCWWVVDLDGVRYSSCAGSEGLTPCLVEFSTLTVDGMYSFYSIQYTINGVPTSCSTRLDQGGDPSDCDGVFLDVGDWALLASEGDTYIESGDKAWGSGHEPWGYSTWEYEIVQVGACPPP